MVSDTISLELCAQEKINIVKSLMDEAFIEVCSLKGLIFYLNPINESSFPLIYHGAATKPHTQMARTEKSGPLAGYILASDEHERTKILEGTSVKVLCDEAGRVMTSDIDVVMIGYMGDVNKDIAYSKSLGQYAAYEKDAIDAVNAMFTEKLKKANPRLPVDSVPLVTHGPFNRFDKTKRTHLHFPMTVYSAEGKMLFGEEASREASVHHFRHLLAQQSNNEYHFDCHPNWGLYED